MSDLNARLLAQRIDTVLDILVAGDYHSAIHNLEILKTELLALFTEWEEAGLVEDFTTFKDELYVVRNKSDRDRVDVLAGPNLINQFRIFAEQIRFIL